MSKLSELLYQYSVDGELYQKLDENQIRCLACGHRCKIPEGSTGICKVRRNEGGKLKVPWGYVAGAQCDPVEKKPFFHVRPGAMAFSFGMLGCDYHCSYCQNWVTSQTLRDPEAGSSLLPTTPEELVRLAVRQHAEIAVSTYNEPLITAEWGVAIFKEAKAAGLMTAFVSNGNATPEVLDYLHPWIDLYKVDLKTFNDRQYRKLGGRLEPVLETIRALKRMDIWVEIVTLLVPGFNDSAEELEELTEFIVNVSPDIPWHVTAFHKNYKMTDPEDTSPRDLFRAAEIGQRAGLKYVYAGNIPGAVKNLENTYCPDCGSLLVERCGYHIRRYLIATNGSCPSCHRTIPGCWGRVQHA